MKRLHSHSAAKRATLVVTLLGALGIAAGLALAASSGPPAPAITSGPLALTTSQSASFSFADSQSKVTFVCAFDGSPYSSCASPKAYAGLTAGSHTFSVEAVDNASRTSSPASYAWTIVLTPPAMAITSPADGGSYNAAGWSAGCTAGTGVCGTATDLSGVTSVIVSIKQNAPSPGKYWNGSGFTSSSEVYNNATLTHTAGGASWFYALPLPSPDGQYTLHVRATNGLLLQTSSASPATSVFTIDTAPPTSAPTIASKPANPTNQTSASFAFSDSEAGVTGFLCKLDSGAYAACSSPQAYSVTQGTHTFSVKATDAAGNAGPAASYTWVVDTTPPPAPVLTQKPPDPNSTATSTFAWTDSESGVTFQCSKENGAFQPCSSPLTYNVPTTNNGQHWFAVQAVDAAGNVAITSYSWKVAAGTPANFTIKGDATGLLYPGATATPLNLTLTNPNSSGETVTSLSATPQSVNAPNATTQHPCSIGDFGSTAYTGTGFTLPPGTNTLQQLGVPQAQWPTVSMPDTHLNQDGCTSAAVTFSYTGSAHT
jgi:hypothetical protein